MRPTVDGPATYTDRFLSSLIALISIFLRPMITLSRRRKSGRKLLGKTEQGRKQKNLAKGGQCCSCHRRLVSVVLTERLRSEWVDQGFPRYFNTRTGTFKKEWNLVDVQCAIITPTKDGPRTRGTTEMWCHGNLPGFWGTWGATGGTGGNDGNEWCDGSRP